MNINVSEAWEAPVLPDKIPAGDMPGDKINIGPEHIQKAQMIFPFLLKELQKSEQERIVISVYGGSGVGKSEINL